MPRRLRENYLSDRKGDKYGFLLYRCATVAPPSKQNVLSLLEGFAFFSLVKSPPLVRRFFLCPELLGIFYPNDFSILELCFCTYFPFCPFTLLLFPGRARFFLSTPLCCCIIRLITMLFTSLINYWNVRYTLRTRPKIFELRLV
jgi:hypothetical protein